MEDREGVVWYLLIAEVLEGDLADSHAIYAYNPAMAVVMLLPEKEFVCVPCVAALRVPVELKNSSGETIRPRVGIIFRKEDLPLIMGSNEPVDNSSGGGCDRIVVEVII